MGTRIHVYLSHDLARFDDVSDTLARLETTLPSALVVAEHWQSVSPGSFELYRWDPHPVLPRLPNIRHYDGPGSLFLTVTSAAARIHTGGRWRGFLGIEPLRRVHITAFRAIAAALNSPTMAICHDSCVGADDAFLANGTQQACVEQLRAAYGPPQPSVEVITPAIVAQAEHGVPSVWYLEERR